MMVWNPAVVEDLLSLSIKVNEQNMLAKLIPAGQREDTMRWSSFHHVGEGLSVRMIAQYTSGDAEVELWFMVYFGGTWWTKPRVEVGPDGVRLEISFGRIDHYLFDLLRPGEWAGTGQAYLTRFTLNFETDLIWGMQLPPFMSTEYAEPFPRQGGGLWPYFGIDHEKLRQTDAQASLYPLAAQPGHFITNTGAFFQASDVHRRKGVFGETWFRSHAKWRGWIEHTDPSNPWRDRHQADQNGQQWMCADDQHMEIWDMLCQMAWTYPHDAGLSLLVRHAAQTFMMQTPLENYGVTKHIPGDPRARGRVLSTGAHLVKALQEIGQSPESEEVLAHTDRLLEIQLEAWDEKPWPLMGKAGEDKHWKMQEYGIYWTGLFLYGRWVSGLDAGSPTHSLMLDLAIKITQLFEKDSRGVWKLPYRYYPDTGTYDHLGGAEHFCIAALQWLKIQGSIEPNLTSILDQHVPVMQSGSLRRFLLPE